MRPEKIWVIYGGESVEKDVSVRTGTNVVAALKSKGFAVKGIEMKSRAELLPLFSTEKPDLVFLGLHGTFGEDGTIQGFLESVAVPYVGSGVLSSAICFNKLTTQKILKHQGLPIAKFFEAARENFSLEKLLVLEKELLQKKYFIKAASQGSTLGVFRYDPADFLESERKEAFGDLCAKAFSFDEEVIIESWIEGRELTCAVVFGEAYPLIEIRPNSKFYDYQSKYTAGETEYLCPAPLEHKLGIKIQQTCEEAARALKCEDYVRIDVMLEADGAFFILEANTLPGMTATSLVPKAAKAKGLTFEEFIEKLVVQSFESQQ